jgi:decaprenylphospho-beta-D-erythro-pentofuranosid-2-ulose 2-reductase
VRNAVDEPQTIVVLGGTSDIGLAIARELSGPSTRHVVLACRDVTSGTAAVASLDLPAGVDVRVVPFDAAAPASHVETVAGIAEAVGDLDVVVLAFGVLGDQAAFEADPASAADAAAVNLGGAMSAGLAVADRLRAQGHGWLVVLSSVSASGRPTSSTAPRRPGSTGSRRGSATRWRAPALTCSSCGPGSCARR